MPKCEKLLERARNSPENITFHELRQLAECFGFTRSRTKGSHHIYKLPGYPEIVNIQEGRNGKAKPYQVKQVVDHIDRLQDRTGDHGSH
jgi:hypothetical protein